MALRIEEREAGPGRWVVRVHGRITLGEAANAIEALVKRLTAQGGLHLVFDLSGVTHIDSTGIGQFIACLNQVRSAGGSLRMAGATGQVRDAFRVTRLDTIFQFDEDVEAALRALP
jgi:anti-sigma B factor antagonist